MKPEAAYLTIYKQLRWGIEKGEYPFAAKLPSKRVTADRFGVSVITAEHAYALLEEEGYIRPRQRSGYFVQYKEGETFPVGEPATLPPPVGTEKEDFPFSVFAKTVRRVLTERGDSLLIKTPNNGSEDLRTAIAHYLARSRGLEVTPDQIVIGSGAEYLYGLILQMLGGEMRYAIEDPSYEKIEQVYQANGVRFERLPLRHHGIDSAALAASAADVLHVTPYRSYPSGVTATAAKKREYIRWAGQEKWLIEDDFESEFAAAMKPVDTLYSLSEQVIYLNTFSKTVAPSMRIGYMVLPRTLISRFWDRVGFYSCTVPTVEQYILTDLINSGDFERHLNRIRRQKRKAERE